MKVLILGGTAEARALAAALDDRGIDVLSSLAGRVARPRLPVGEVRIGGFGGVAGLRACALGFDAVVDATHPFSARISANAAAACQRPAAAAAGPAGVVRLAVVDLGRLARGGGRRGRARSADARSSPSAGRSSAAS